MIGTSHRFKDIIGVIFEEVLHIEMLGGGGDGALSTVPGHHAGSERRGRHCTPAPDIVTKWFVATLHTMGTVRRSHSKAAVDRLNTSQRPSKPSTC